jgi:multiple sugar transport system permease protein
MKKYLKKYLHRKYLILFCALFVLLVFVIFPYLWAVITSLKIDSQIRSGKSMFWPSPFTLKHYIEVLTKTPFLTWYLNSTITAVASTIIGIFAGAPAAYALTRFKFRGKNIISTLVFVTYVVPATLLFIPFMVMMSAVKLNNTLMGITIIYTTLTVPFCTWVLLGFFKSIPEELGESAQLDGCSKFTAFLKIDLPLVTPGLIAVALFSFNLAWMEYIYALTLLTNDMKKTLPIGISSLQVGDMFPWGTLMSAAVLTSVPIIILFIFLQRYFISGLTVGAVKG